MKTVCKLLILTNLIGLLCGCGAGSTSSASSANSNPSNINSLSFVPPAAVPSLSDKNSSTYVLVDNKSNVNLSNISYSITDKTISNGNIVIDPTTSGQCSQIVANGQCKLKLTVSANTKPGSFAISANGVSKSSPVAVQKVNYNYTTKADGVMLLYSKEVSTSAGQILVSGVVNSSLAGKFNTINLVDENGNVIANQQLLRDSTSDEVLFELGDTFNIILNQVDLPLDGGNSIKMKVQTEEVISGATLNKYLSLTNYALHVNSKAIINAFPNSIYLEGVNSQQISLSNLGNVSATLKNISSDNPHLVIESFIPEVLNVESKQDIRVYLDQDITTDPPATLTITYNDGINDTQLLIKIVATGSPLWVWMNNESGVNERGVYGSSLLGSESNAPGARSYGLTWVDKNNNLWLFGGYGLGGHESQQSGNLNDLWKYNLNSHTWEWVSGSDLVGQAGVYNTQGQPSSDGTPGARSIPSGWVDSDNNLWLFGGGALDEYYQFRFYSDLWKYNIQTEKWTWVSGYNTPDHAGIYNVMAQDFESSIPGGRDGSVNFTDSNGNFWLFGGSGFDGDGQLGDLNDLWKYNIHTGIWTWMGGMSVVNQAGHYGVQGNPSVANNPGARSLASGWVTHSSSGDKLWLFGGSGYDSVGTNGYLNDLWSYDINTGSWTWVSGSNLVNQPDSFGVKGEASSTNIPGARSSFATWNSDSNTLWLYGGYTYLDGNNYHSDLWKYDIPNGKWTWMNGYSVKNILPGYDIRGVSSISSYAGGRAGSMSWANNIGFWTFGGTGYKDNQIPSFNDLWWLDFNK